MKLSFKPNSEVANIVKEMFDKKELMHEKAIQIIEEETGCKIKEGSGLGYIYAFSYNYHYRFSHCYFEDGITDVPGYKQELDDENRICFRINKRSKKAKEIERRFENEVSHVSSRLLNVFGIKTEIDGRWFGWRLIKEDNGEITMPIHPNIYDIIDFEKAKDVVVIQ